MGPTSPAHGSLLPNSNDVVPKRGTPGSSGFQVPVGASGGASDRWVSHPGGREFTSELWFWWVCFLNSQLDWQLFWTENIVRQIQWDDTQKSLSPRQRGQEVPKTCWLLSLLFTLLKTWEVSAGQTQTLEPILNFQVNTVNNFTLLIFLQVEAILGAKRWSWENAGCW